MSKFNYNTITIIISDLKKFGSIFQTHSIGVPPIVHHKPLWQASNNKKGPQRRRAHMKKESSFQLIIIQPQNRGGGGHLIFSPPPSKSWGGGEHVPLPPPPPPPPPQICAHDSLRNFAVLQSGEATQRKSSLPQSWLLIQEKQILKMTLLQKNGSRIWFSPWFLWN